MRSPVTIQTGEVPSLSASGREGAKGSDTRWLAAWTGKEPDGILRSPEVEDGRCRGKKKGTPRGWTGS